MRRFLTALLMAYGCSSDEQPKISEPSNQTTIAQKHADSETQPPSFWDTKFSGITIKKYVGELFGYGRVGLEVVKDEETGAVYEATIFLIDRQTDFRMENTRGDGNFESVLVFRRGGIGSHRLYSSDPEFEEYRQTAKSALKILQKPRLEIRK